MEIFKRAKELAINTHKMTLGLPKFELYEEGGQIRRSSKSVANNIVEGYCLRKNKNEFVQYLNLSYGSCGETIQHLELLFEAKSLKNKALCGTVRSEYEILSKQFFRFVQVVNESHDRQNHLKDIEREYSAGVSVVPNHQSPWAPI